MTAARTHPFRQRPCILRPLRQVRFLARPQLPTRIESPPLGETLGLVGKSGSGKTITCLSILKLLPRGARIIGGQILFEGEDFVPKTEAPEFWLRDGRQVRCWLRESEHVGEPVRSPEHNEAVPHEELAPPA
jgi:hypothetical protein